jgi:hypothetical protein
VAVESVPDHQRSPLAQQGAGHRVGVALARYENYRCPHRHSLLKILFNKPPDTLQCRAGLVENDFH